jgi:hypothetical protein
VSNCLVSVVQSYGPLITAGAIFISGLVAAIAIYHNLSTARRRATIDVVMHEKMNPALVAARKKVLALHERDTEFVRFALKEHADSDEATTILTVLNFREFVAAGIREKAFDEDMFKRIQFSVVARDWQACEGFVRELRRLRGRPTLFQEFQWLAERWLADPLKIDH